MAHGPTLACRLSQPTGGSALTVSVAAIAVIRSRVGAGKAGLLQAFDNGSQVTAQRPGAAALGAAPGDTVRLNHATW